MAIPKPVIGMLNGAITAGIVVSSTRSGIGDLAVALADNFALALAGGSRCAGWLHRRTRYQLDAAVFVGHAKFCTRSL
jgi:hypothetical protein